MLERRCLAGSAARACFLSDEFLAEAGMREGKYVSWLPSYGPEDARRHGNCSVVLSDREIASPVITGS